MKRLLYVVKLNPSSCWKHETMEADIPLTRKIGEMSPTSLKWGKYLGLDGRAPHLCTTGWSFHDAQWSWPQEMLYRHSTSCSCAPAGKIGPSILFSYCVCKIRNPKALCCLESFLPSGELMHARDGNNLWKLSECTEVLPRGEAASQLSQNEADAVQDGLMLRKKRCGQQGVRME